ncbi:MAG: hypothetical protein AVDCRST_MAG85-830 [uncultured Solirubrobacteraceae bacterium]|uniref:Uncharacterized protein n=1 Tax=uncultured Solirubrobacteraceae bacterium TaxID=1162706 RepID=A0A6J4RWX0_9ACTN|nr:MAG: hypothetical protein AVDCRST_MAG85-830 [uncultured Solirubrobacteraceae bacterium]
MNVTGTSDERAQLRFDANIDLLPNSEGGRQTAIGPSYRSNVWFGEISADGNPLLNGCAIETTEPIDPGASAAVSIVPFYPEYWADVDDGAQFDLLEGLRRVGRGTVIHAPPETERVISAKRRLASDLERRIRAFVAPDVVRRPAPGGGIDFELTLSRADAHPGIVVGEFKLGRARVSDVQRLADQVNMRSSDLGLLIGLSEPSREIQRALFSHGTRVLPDGRPLPRLLYLSVPALARPESWWFLGVVSGREEGSATGRSATLAVAA